MRTPVILVTGANGEIGHGLLHALANTPADAAVLTLDLKPLDPELQHLTSRHIQGDVLDRNLLARLVAEYEIRVIYHLAALLSTRSEFTPETAHQVNVEGTLNLLRIATEQAQWQRRPVTFLFPSSIAAYGLPDRETKMRLGPVREDEWNMPTTMYGCNKLYCEHLGRYYARHYRQLAAETEPFSVDFRAIRFPGLISAVTVPSGGTSDYAPEMLHAAATGQPYDCFVREDTAMPFMAMPDAVAALCALAAAPRDRLTRLVYNVTAFSFTAAQFRDRVLSVFPDARITFRPDPRRQAIVDSWPADVDDSAARRDWNFSPAYDLDRAFTEYLVPTIRQRYAR